MIRPAISTDAKSISNIYNYYILNTVVTFEELTITVAEIQGRINEATTQQLPWLVAEEAGEVWHGKNRTF